MGDDQVARTRVVYAVEVVVVNLSAKDKDQLTLITQVQLAPGDKFSKRPARYIFSFFRFVG